MEELKRGDIYYSVCFMYPDNVKDYRWSDDKFDRELMEKGLVFTTQAACSEKARDMLVMTK